MGVLAECRMKRRKWISTEGDLDVWWISKREGHHTGSIIRMVAKLSDIFRIAETEVLVWLLFYFWRHGFSG